MAKKLKKKSKKRRRLTREETKGQMAQSSGANWFNLDKDVEVWSPDKKGKYNLDILPYEVKTDKHPEQGIEKGVLWFRTEFTVHYGLGIEQVSIVCPRSIGQKCRVCDEAERLSKEDYEENEEVIRGLRGQKWVLMNILHPETDEVAIFAMSKGKFDNPLREELQEEENEEHLDFYQAEDGGRTLKVRFSEKSFMGNKYLQATNIEFLKREDMDEEDILEKVFDLDSILNVLPSTKIESMFMQGDDEDEDEVKPKARKRKVKDEEPEEEIEEEEDFEEEEEEEEESDWEEDENPEEDDPEEDFEEDDFEEEEEPEEEEPEEDEDEDDWDNDWDEDEEEEELEEEEEEEPEPPKKKKGKRKTLKKKK